MAYINFLYYFEYTVMIQSVLIIPVKMEEPALNYCPGTRATVRLVLSTETVNKSWKSIQRKQVYTKIIQVSIQHLGCTEEVRLFKQHVTRKIQP